MKTKIIIGLILAAVAAVIYFIIRKKKEVRERPSGSETPQERLNAQLNPIANDSFPLKIGSKGPKVRALQTFLNTLSEDKISVDGIYGKETDLAVFYKLNGAKQVSQAQFDQISREAYAKSDVKSMLTQFPGSTLIQKNSISDKLMFGTYKPS